MTDASAIFSFVANHIWQSVLLAVVLAGLLAARGRLSAQMRHALAFAALVAAAALPLAMLLPGNDTLLASAASSLSPTPAQNERVLPIRIDPARDAPPVVVTGADAEPYALPATPVYVRVDPWNGGDARAAEPAPPPAPRAPAASAPKLRFDPAQRPLIIWSLVALWLAGAAVLLTRTGFDVAAAERLRRRATPLTLPASLAHLAGGHEVRESADAAGPMVAGLLRPTIILPAGLLERRGPQEMIGLLEHERAHVERGDLPLALIQRLLTAALWWSPAMHWIAARVEEEREMACDEAAAARVGDARAFARALTDHAEAQLFWGWPRLVVGATRSRSQLGRRVRRLLEIAGSDGVRKRIASRASAAALLVVIAVTAVATPRLEAQAQDEPPAPPAVAAPAAPAAAPAPPAPVASAEVRRATAALARAEAQLERAIAEQRRAHSDPSRLARAERERDSAERDLERAREDLERALAEAEVRSGQSLEDFNEATEELAAAQDEVERARERLNEAAGRMSDDPSQADEVREAAQELAEAQRELRRAARRLERAAITVDVRGRAGAAPGFRLSVQGPDSAHQEEIERAAQALAEAVGTMVGDFDFDVDLDPEVFARLEKLEGLQGLQALKELEHLQYLPAVSFSASGWRGRDDSPLMMAARMGNEEMVRLLVDAGADVNATDPGESTVLMMAVRSGDADLVGYLLEAGADPNVVVPREGSPLLLATRMGDADMVRLLIEAGADVNAETPYEGTALTAAVRSGDVELVRLLIDLGADIDGLGSEDR